MSTLIQPTRRKFLTGIGCLLAAPAIVRASSIMPVRSPVWTKEEIHIWPNQRVFKILARVDDKGEWHLDTVDIPLTEFYASPSK